MLQYIKDAEYETLLGIHSIPDSFNRLAIEASSYINHKTFGRIDENDVPEKVKYVTCLIVDLIEEQETKLSEIKNLKSEDIEGWKKTFATPKEIKEYYSQKMQTTLSEHLWDVIGKDGLPLLYCGVC